MSTDQWFDVDRKGLASLIERRGKTSAVYEVVQNAWDADGTTRVEITLEPIPGRPKATFRVTDDSPDGFRDLTHAYRLFAPSDKLGDPEKRGRFNLGEKLVLSLCESAQVSSTTGTVSFASDGTRRRSKTKTESGSVFQAVINMARSEVEECLGALSRLIPPRGIETIINGDPLHLPMFLRSFEVALPTEVADDEGILRRTTRKTDVEVIEPQGDKPFLYEMGIPVVEIDVPWDLNVAQKVPLNMERTNVTPAYARKLHAAALDHCTDLLTAEMASQGWATDALTDAKPETVAAAIETRFGKDAVIYDPSNPEANKIAVERGAPVIHGRTFTKAQWGAVRQHSSLLPAGQAHPTGIPSSADGQPPIPRADWTPQMDDLAHYTRMVAKALGFDCAVEFQNLPMGRPGHSAAWWGANTITFNLGSLGKTWPERAGAEELDALLIHEFAHRKASDHYSRDFYDECCRLGAALRNVDFRWGMSHPPASV